MRGARYGVVFASIVALGACATLPPAEDDAPGDLAAAVAARDGGAIEALVLRDVTRAKPLSSLADWRAALRQGASLDGRFWRALLAEAAADQRGAWDGWLALIADRRAPEGVAAAAAARLRGLVEEVALGPDDVSGLGRALARRDALRAAAGSLLATVAARVGDPAAEARGRAAWGPIVSYRITARLSPLPATGRPAPLDLAPGGAPPEVFGASRPTRAGAVALPSWEAGVYGVLVPLPDAPRARVEVVGEAQVRAFVGGVLVAEGLRFTEPGPRRALSFVVASGPGARLELQVSSRAYGPPIGVAITPVLEAGPAPPAAVLPLTEAVAGLLVAIDARDPWAVDAVAARLPGAGPVTAWLLAEAALADETLPGAVARGRARANLDAALEVEPTLAAARSRRARLALEEGDAPGTTAIAGAGPLGDHAGWLAVDIALAGGGELPEEHAAALRARLPTSCEAFARWLDAGWERLKLAGRPLAPPRGCVDVGVRTAELLIEGWRLDDAVALLTALAPDARPGAERARIELALGRVAFVRGDAAAAERHAAAALADGADRDAAIELALRTARLYGDASAVERVRAAARATPGLGALTIRQAALIEAAPTLRLTDARSLLGPPRAPRAEDADLGSYEVLLEDHSTRVFPDGAMLHRVHRVVRLLEANAVAEFGEVAVPDAAEVLLARTWRPTPSGWQAVEPEEIVEKSSISLPALERGAVAELAWFWLEPADPRLSPGWETPPFRFDSDRGPVRRARLTLQLPPGVTPEIAADAGVPTPVDAGGGRLVWEMTELPRVLLEPLDPRPDRRLLTVRVRHGVSLEAAARRLADDVASGLTITPSVRALTDEALANAAPGAPALERARALHRFVRAEVHDGSEPVAQANASFAAASRAGERAVLLAAMLRAAAVDADVALARPLSEGLVDPRDDDVGAYSYPIVRARADGRELWLESASRTSVFDVLPPLIQGVPALVLRDDGPAQRVETPRAAGEEGGERVVTLRVDVDDGGAYVATAREELSGIYGGSWKQALAGMAPDTRQRVLEGLAGRVLVGATVEEVVARGVDEPDGPLVVTWRARGRLSPGPGGAPGVAALTLGLAPEGLGRATVLLPVRTTPLLVNHASRLRLTATVRLPVGLAFRAAPEGIEVAEGPLAVRRASTLAADRGTLEIYKTVNLDAGIVAPTDYGAWRRAAHAADRADVVQLVIERRVAGGER